MKHFAGTIVVDVEVAAEDMHAAWSELHEVAAKVEGALYQASSDINWLDCQVGGQVYEYED